MIDKNTKDVLLLMIFSAVCTLGAVFGARLRDRSETDEGNKISRDKLITRLYLAGGAGLVTALIGNGLHINKSLIIGASIVIGYAGGRKFFSLAQKMFDALARRKLRDINRRDSDSTEHTSERSEKTNDDEKNDTEVQSGSDHLYNRHHCSCALDCP